MFPISNNVQSPDNAFLHKIITLITEQAAELQLGPAEAAVSGREFKIDLLRKISPCGHGQLLEISPELAASALAS